MVAKEARGADRTGWGLAGMGEPDWREAYVIPLAASKRARSTAILTEVPDRFGYRLMPFAEEGFRSALRTDAGSHRPCCF